jgi:diguanylate cyclase (GGDEF)-like protein/PAS domain S-box-containing protein
MIDSTHAAGGGGTSQRFRSLDDPETLRELARYLREGLYVTDGEGRLLDANAAFLEIVGSACIDEIVGRPFEDFLADPAPRRTALGLPDATVRELELTVVRADGEQREILDTVYQRRDESGQLFRHGIITDATQYRALEARLRESATRDSLTGAYNRRHLDVIARDVERGTGGGWGCLYVDIEGFGAYNMRQGRDAGDDVLIRMARFLMRHVRADEPVIRLSNDEFVVVLRGASDQRTERVARRLQLTALRTAPIAFALGWAMREDGEGIDALVARAAQRQIPVRVVERMQDARGRLVEEPAAV